MSRPTRRRAHGRKKTHRRYGGVPEKPKRILGTNQQPLIESSKPSYVPPEEQRTIDAAAAAASAHPTENYGMKPSSSTPSLSFKKNFLPVKMGGDPSDMMERSAKVDKLEGGVKHEHAVTIVVDYSKDGKSLTEAEKKKLMKHIKTNHYYHGALKGKNSMKHEDTATHTRVSVLWKNGKLHKGGEDWDRVHELLTDDLPHGIKAKHVHTE